MSVRSWFFDFDGTLVDSLPGISFSIQQSFNSCGLQPPTSDIRTMIGPSVRTILSRLSESVTGADIEKLESAFRISYDTEGWTRTVAFPQVLETMRSLARTGAKLFVFTNKPSKVTMQITHRLGIEGLLQEALSRDSSSPPYASKSEMLRDLMDRHNISATSSAVVGDSREDMDAARTNNQQFFFASYGYGTISQSEFNQQTVILKKFSDLMTHCPGAF
jgi:phosphoglycolate phosphatase